MSQDNDIRSLATLNDDVASTVDLDERRVVDYLRGHRDFFVKRADLLQEMTPPARWSGDTVVDMQRHMLDSLRGEIAGLRDCANEVIETSRANLATQTRTHAAVLALAASANLADLVRAVSDDLPILLDVDVATLGVEPISGLEPMVGGVGRLRAGDVDRFVGVGREVALYREMSDDGTIFGAGAGLVRSAALARLRYGEDGPSGLLAFGSRSDGAFHPGQGSELLRFLGRIVDVCLIRLLPISD
jgi:uncharacterized protein